MRLDKYLKVSRLIKRRTLAKEVAENERILVNGKFAKPSKELKIGDEITIEFGNKSVTVKVASLEVSTKKADAINMYEFISDVPKEFKELNISSEFSQSLIFRRSFMITLDYLPRTNIQLYQDDEMIRINTDTEVLGEFLEVYRNDTVLDMGTNLGALLLYASKFTPKKLIGLEINERGCELAKKNMELNNITNYEIINGDIITYTSTPVDVIICNPPYFKTDEHNKGDNKFLAIAKHEGILTLDKLITSIKRNLKDNGTLYFLYMTPRLDEVLAELNKNNIIPKVLKFVYDHNKKTSNIFLVKAVKNAKKGLVVEKPIMIDRNKK